MAKEKLYRFEHFTSFKGIDVDDKTLEEAITTCNEMGEDRIEIQIAEREMVDAVAYGTITNLGWNAKSNLDKFVEKCLDCGAIDDGRMNEMVTARIAMSCLKRLITAGVFENIEEDIAKALNKTLKQISNGGY